MGDVVDVQVPPTHISLAGAKVSSVRPILVPHLRAGTIVPPTIRSHDLLDSGFKVHPRADKGSGLDRIPYEVQSLKVDVPTIFGRCISATLTDDTVYLLKLREAILALERRGTNLILRTIVVEFPLAPDLALQTLHDSMLIAVDTALDFKAE